MQHHHVHHVGGGTIGMTMMPAAGGGGGGGGASPNVAEPPSSKVSKLLGFKPSRRTHHHTTNASLKDNKYIKRRGISHLPLPRQIVLLVLLLINCIGVWLLLSWRNNMTINNNDNDLSPSAHDSRQGLQHSNRIYRPPLVLSSVKYADMGGGGGSITDTNGNNENDESNTGGADGAGSGNRLRAKPATDSNSMFRIAIIIPFVGESMESIPPYIELFCHAAKGSANLVDFLIIHNGVLDDYYGTACGGNGSSSDSDSNVKFISLQTMENFAKYLIRVLDDKPTEEWSIEVDGEKKGKKAAKDEHYKQQLQKQKQHKMIHILTKILGNFPYVLVEFKPALGYIFEEFIPTTLYTHWGYSDMDILFGDISRWTTYEELTQYDIVTYGYGDQHRLYLRGQFTFHKNLPRTINKLWKRCTYLSDMDIRFQTIISGKTKLQFESAEGCYSSSILQTTNVKVKYAVKAFTDVKDNDTANTHGLYIGLGSSLDRSVIYKYSNQQHSNKAISHGWFEQKDTIYANPTSPIQWEVGKREEIPLPDNPESKCMFWAKQDYQNRLCLEKDVNDNAIVDSSYTVYWINGRLYKQMYEMISLPNDIVSSPFFHFQEWKRYYRPSQLLSFHRLTSLLPSATTRSAVTSTTFALFKEGAIPIYDGDGVVDTTHRRSYADQGGTTSPSSLGLSNLNEWNGAKADNDRRQLPSPSYCLKSGPRKFPPTPPAPQCQFVTSWRDMETVEILSGATGLNDRTTTRTINQHTDVTLALTLQISAEQAASDSIIQGLLDLITMYIDRWQGQPCVLVIHVAGATPNLVAKLRVRLGHGSDLSYGLDMCLIAGIFSREPDVLSRKALLNMAIDAAPTRWVLSGLELERGMVISYDTAYFAHRTARTYAEHLPGHVFVMPQFGIDDDTSEYTISSLWKAEGAGNLVKLPKLDVKGSCDDSKDTSSEEAGENGEAVPGSSSKGDVFLPFVDLWWQLTESLIVEANNPESKIDEISEGKLKQRTAQLDAFQLSLIGLLTEANHYHLFAMDASPILLTDNLGPRRGMRTSELVREVEEFGGKQCYNGLRLAQLATLGYQVDVLVGAFAASTGSTRELAFAGLPNAKESIHNEKPVLGHSRCDGCFFFDEKHEDILEDIVKDERIRPAKAALLWD